VTDKILAEKARKCIIARNLTLGERAAAAAVWAAIKAKTKIGMGMKTKVKTKKKTAIKRVLPTAKRDDILPILPTLGAFILLRPVDSTILFFQRDLVIVMILGGVE